MAQKMVELKRARSAGKQDLDDMINVRFDFGSIVVAKVGRYPYWPAMVDHCPDTGDFYWMDDFNNLTKTNASHYHVVFFDIPEKVTRSWVHTSKISHYFSYYPNALSAEEIKAVSKLSLSSTKRRFIEARLLAESAALMTVDEREAKYSFVQTYRGKITLFDNDGNKTVIDRTKSARDRPHPASNIKVSNKRKKAINDKTADLNLSLISSPLSVPDKTEEIKNSTPTDKFTSPSNKKGTRKRKNTNDNDSLDVSSPHLDSLFYAHELPVQVDSLTPAAQPLPSPKKKRRSKGTKRLSKKKNSSSPNGKMNKHVVNDLKKTSPIKSYSTTPEKVPLLTPMSNIDKGQLKNSIRDANDGAADHQNNGGTIEKEISSLISRMENNTAKPKAVEKNASNSAPLDDPLDVIIDLTSDDERACNFKCGEVVYANLRGLKPWPALIVNDPDMNVWFIPEDSTPNHLHVVFFQLSKNAWIPLENITPFDGKNSPEEHVNTIQYIQAAQEAKHAMSLTRCERIALYGNRVNGSTL